MKLPSRSILSMVAGLATGACTSAIHAQLEWQRPAQGPGVLSVVNITNDYTVRDWANYHNTQCWSQDGRYTCYTRYASDGRQFGLAHAAEVHVVDLSTGQDRLVGKGHSPRWANARNWLFYVRMEGPDEDAGGQVWWLDLETDKQVLLGTGMNVLGGVTFDDRWVMGAGPGATARRVGYRMAVRAGAEREYLPGLDGGGQWVPNPVYNVAFARFPNLDRNEHPFAATRYWFDIDGRNIRVGAEFLSQSHHAWLGNGEYYMMGNSQVRGRKWNEPFPSSIHFLASVPTGDISPASRSGRFVIGDKPMTMADLRSGDGWYLLDDLSIICYPEKAADDSGPYDSDAKGSPDGTKMAFASTYDLVNGPVTFITSSAPDGADRVEVESTANFPPSGEITIHREVIEYTHKTPTSFEGLTHKKYGTSGFGRAYSPMSAGRPVTSWAARLIPQEEWRSLPQPAGSIQRAMGGMIEPLIRQKSSDVWLAQIRRPDRPWLRANATRAELIPGEHHHETLGYHLYRDGARVTSRPIRAGDTRELAPGDYTAVAVEWSGLESPPSESLQITSPTTLSILRDTPADFVWTWDRWQVNDSEVDWKTAVQSGQALKEVHHRYDGVIARQWHEWGDLKARHDLNADGQAIRRQNWHQGRLFSREFHNRAGEHVSTEYFDDKENVNETIRYRHADGRRIEVDHWWYKDCMPERRIASSGAHRVESPAPVMFVRSGDKWRQVDYVGHLVPAQDLIGPRRNWEREAAGK